MTECPLKSFAWYEAATKSEWSVVHDLEERGKKQLFY